MLTGKTALVTGASRGIGRAIALSLANAGADVVVNYAGNAQAADEVVGLIEAMGRQTFKAQADVSSAEQAEGLVKQTLERFGKLDILINNAGITRDNLIMRMKEDEFDEVIATNLKGVFNLIKAASRPMMKQRFGRIVNLSSVVGVLGNAGQANYVASKAGVIGLTKSAARELASRNITVNCVAPGFIETDMTGKLTDAMKQQMLGQIPLARFGQPADVAGMVRFLVCAEAAYITGQTLHVDGGMYM
jgi:3-oxoacyl-[acyl-carrier protein] reductase